jgi:ferredoxin-NADP reductase
MDYIQKIQSIVPVTHDVHRFRLDKPEGYEFIPGQATEVSINRAGWVEERRPFTFTSLNSDPYLEFTIKSYPHNGVTQLLGELKPGDELIVRDVWGAIHYKGPGLFIAGGAGITPFIAIFRDLAQKNSLNRNRLLFANKTKKDIIIKDELEKLLGDNFVNILSDEKVEGYKNGYINKELLQELLPGYNENLYICGPPPMMDAVQKILTELGIGEKSIVVEI